MPRLAFYIDSHGFGHTTRSIALAAALPKDWEIHFKTNGPNWLFQEELLRDFQIQSSTLDIHPIQSEGYLIDANATQEFLLDKYHRAEKLIDAEIRWLRENRIDIVLSDISPLAIEAGFRCGIPSYGISNFTWHWIMEPMLDESECHKALEFLKGITGHATNNFRLPFSEPSVFPGESVDTPLVTRSPRVSREEFRSRCGMDNNTKYVLVTFGGFDDPDRNFSALEGFSPIQFVRTLHHTERLVLQPDHYLRQDKALSNLWHFIHPELYHPDLVGAVDAVITKPGYGILSETMPLGTPLILDTREDFREFGIIQDVLEDYPQVAFIPCSRMASLNFGEELERILEVVPIPWKGRTDGAEFIIENIQ